jgi:hypothetical protein
MAQRYRKKPVVIEAIQFVGNDSATEILKWTGTPPVRANIDPGTGVAESLEIATLEGEMTCSPGDFVIRGVQGEFYPCKPDIFAATYEPVTDDV